MLRVTNMTAEEVLKDQGYDVRITRRLLKAYLQGNYDD
jgi:hypothetical protein